MCATPIQIVFSEDGFVPLPSCPHAPQWFAYLKCCPVSWRSAPQRWLKAVWQLAGNAQLNTERRTSARLWVEGREYSKTQICEERISEWISVKWLFQKHFTNFCANKCWSWRLKGQTVHALYGWQKQTYSQFMSLWCFPWPLQYTWTQSDGRLCNSTFQ